jgi:hypothetical protein
MLQYYRSIQRPRKAYHINLPAAIVSVMEFSKKETVEVSLASDRGTKVVTIRKLEKVPEQHAN